MGSQTWKPQAQDANQSVETLELRSGATLVLSRFDPGEPRSFSFTEPEDTFGFGFHLKGGACFEMEHSRFESRALDVWTSAGPKGSVSQFTLPSTGFRTVSIRFKPEVAEDFFANGLALPSCAGKVLERAREDVGTARLAPLASSAAMRLDSMFTTPYADSARHLYLESCVLELLAGQIASLSGHAGSPPRSLPSHWKKALAAQDHLDSTFRDPPTIAELSRIVGTNEFTLKRAFKETFGTTIFGYVSQRRMERAKDLLNQGMSVSSVAYEVGYGCVRSFSIAFSRQLGRSPSAMRRASL